jgi:hypothetical protein
MRGVMCLKGLQLEAVLDSVAVARKRRGTRLSQALRPGFKSPIDFQSVGTIVASKEGCLGFPSRRKVMPVTGLTSSVAVFVTLQFRSRSREV